VKTFRVPLIATYIGTSTPAVRNRDTKAIGTATCNFIQDALNNGFFYTRNLEYTNDSPTTFLRSFKCRYDPIQTESGVLQIEYTFIPTFEMPRNINPNPFLSQNQLFLNAVWTSIISYFQDKPVQTVGITEEVMSVRVKEEIAPTSPYQLYTEIVPTVTPYTQVFNVKDLVITYIGTGGVPVTASDTQAVVDSSCAYIIENLPYSFKSLGAVFSNIECSLLSSSNTGGPLQITYDVVVTIVVGPTLSPDHYYLENAQQDDFAFEIEVMLKDRFYIFEETPLPEMSAKVKEAIGPNNPYYSYTKVIIKQFLQY
jgi:hypothetical protein